jgi:drug/metabolite transporter (DMT)-like permease
MTERTERRGRRGWVVVGLGIAALVVVVAAYFASSEPDGLERVAEDVGFLGAGEDSPFTIIADYVFPGMDGPLATILAGLLGIAGVFAVAWLAGKALSRRRA